MKTTATQEGKTGDLELRGPYSETKPAKKCYTFTVARVNTHEAYLLCTISIGEMFVHNLRHVYIIEREMYVQYLSVPEGVPFSLPFTRCTKYRITSLEKIYKIIFWRCWPVHLLGFYLFYMLYISKWTLVVSHLFQVPLPVRFTSRISTVYELGKKVLSVVVVLRIFGSISFIEFDTTSST